MQSRFHSLKINLAIFGAISHCGTDSCWAICDFLHSRGKTKEQYFLLFGSEPAAEQTAFLPPTLVLRVGWGRSCVLVMAVVEDFADAATCALGDFACALRGTDADVLAGDARAFADVACSVDGVEGDEIAGAFADALGCRSGSLGGALTDVAGSAADVTAGAARLGLSLG